MSPFERKTRLPTRARAPHNALLTRGFQWNAPGKHTLGKKRLLNWAEKLRAFRFERPLAHIGSSGLLWIWAGGAIVFFIDVPLE